MDYKDFIGSRVKIKCFDESCCIVGILRSVHCVNIYVENIFTWRIRKENIIDFRVVDEQLGLLSKGLLL